jgi:hypothetical protein
MRTERQRDRHMTKLTVALRNFANTPKNIHIIDEGPPVPTVVLE